MNFNEIINANKQNIKNIIKLITKQENEDIEQEVYIKLWKNAEKYEERGSLKSWVNTIAKNTSKGYALTFIAFNCSSEELMDLSNCQIYFKGQPYDDTDIYLDCINSHTIKPNLLFSEKDNERYLEFRKNLSSSNLISKLNDLLD